MSKFPVTSVKIICLCDGYLHAFHAKKKSDLKITLGKPNSLLKLVAKQATSKVKELSDQAQLQGFWAAFA